MILCPGCETAQPWYPPPMQRKYTGGATPRVLGEAMTMNSPAADRHVISGTLGGEPGSPWRWTREKVDLRFQLASLERPKFFLKFAVSDVTFKQTGPVTLSFTLNGKMLGTQRYNAPGEFLYEKPVPPGWLNPNDTVYVSIAIDKPWIAEDQSRLGFLLISAGFKD